MRTHFLYFLLQNYERNRHYILNEIILELMEKMSAVLDFRGMKRPDYVKVIIIRSKFNDE